MTLNNKPERTDNTTAMWQMAIKDQTPAALCGHKMIPLTWCWWRFCWDLFSSEHWPRLLPPDSGTRSVPRLHLSLSAGAKHSRPAAKPWTGAESQSYERTDVSTPLLHLLPTFTTTTTVLVPCCVLRCRYSSLFFCSGLFWRSWFRRRKTTSKTWASWWRWGTHTFMLLCVCNPPANTSQQYPLSTVHVTTWST